MNVKQTLAIIENMIEGTELVKELLEEEKYTEATMLINSLESQQARIQPVIDEIENIVTAYIKLTFIQKDTDKFIKSKFEEVTGSEFREES